MEHPVTDHESPRSILVTGATSGIGRAAALAFARRGASVAVLGRDERAGAETVERIHELGGKGIFVRADVTVDDEVRSAVRRTVEEFGGLDCAVNSAGVEADGRALAEASPELFDRIMGVNVKGVWASLQAEIRAMLDGGGGTIVNVASVGGTVGFPGASIYSASKHAVVGLTRAAALEYAAQGIRVNAVAPGTVDTPMFSRFGGDDPDVRALVTAMHPMGRIAQPEEVADAITWLCSPGSSFVTGHVLAVDGGFTAQ